MSNNHLLESLLHEAMCEAVVAPRKTVQCPVTISRVPTDVLGTAAWLTEGTALVVAFTASFRSSHVLRSAAQTLPHEVVQTLDSYVQDDLTMDPPPYLWMCLTGHDH